MASDVLEKVSEVVRLYDRPVSANDIAQASNLSHVTTLNALKALVSQGTIDLLSTENQRYFQYHQPEKSKEEENLEVKFAQLDEALNEKNEELDERINQVEKETAHIYANLISIMGVFVAIFTLIIINANAIAGTISQDEKIGGILLKLIVLNLPVAICIIALLLGIRFIILRDFKRGDRK